MAYDPYYASSPSDSGLLDGHLADLGSAQAASNGSVPCRDEYQAPAPSPVDTSEPEESLRDVPLPTGFLTRLRGEVDKF